MSDISFKYSYEKLGEKFYSRSDPQSVVNPGLICFNHILSVSLGLSESSLNETQGLAYFAGNKIPPGSQPLAMAYSGHQFGHFSPQLGDGRALLLGDIVSPKGEQFDLQLKGSGRTYFSRGGDGRSALGPVLREYLVSEAMYKLGIPTTRALAAVTTGENVFRDKLVAGGILTRVSRSFIRVGTFQYFSSQNDLKSVKKLADYVMHRSYPEIRNSKRSYRELLRFVIDRQASLIANWMQFGFIHGVMNTDNMSIAGETIDYGPCAFMDGFEYNKVFSFIDKNGRYAYANQPSIALWNLTRFAETILSLLAVETKDAIRIAEDELNQFVDAYESYWLEGMRSKLGITSQLIGEKRSDKKLIDDLSKIMVENKTDFTLTFRELSKLTNRAGNASHEDSSFLQLFESDTEVQEWLKLWRARIGCQPIDDSTRMAKMQQINPAVIPRNHQVEAAIRAAEDSNDFSKFNQLNQVLQNPFEETVENKKYRQAPRKTEIVERTFCGT